MSGKIIIIICGILAGIISASVAYTIFTFTHDIFLGRLITIAGLLVTTGIIYALVYASTDSLKTESEGIPSAIFAGIVGGVLFWAIGDGIFGPLQSNGMLLAGSLGGLLMGMQVDPRRLI